MTEGNLTVGKMLFALIQLYALLYLQVSGMLIIVSEMMVMRMMDLPCPFYQCTPSACESDVSQ